jgi:hypothetical protein
LALADALGVLVEELALPRRSFNALMKRRGWGRK